MLVQSNVLCHEVEDDGYRTVVRTLALHGVRCVQRAPRRTFGFHIPVYPNVPNSYGADVDRLLVVGTECLIEFAGTVKLGARDSRCEA